MTDEEKDRLIVEALGECWHEFGGFHYSVSTCKKCQLLRCSDDYIEFTPEWGLDTPEGFFWWWERVGQKPWLPKFLNWWWEKATGKTKLKGWLILIPPMIHYVKSRDALAEWLETHPEVWK